MRLAKILDETQLSLFSLPLDAFTNPVNVQGAEKREYQNALLITSGKRYKLFTNGVDRIKILEGEGHFKWARGETPFRAGDCFSLEQTGEYEVNGKCAFLIVRS